MTLTTSNNNSNFNNMAEQENIPNIANAKIVYVVAVSGCGKSFTGDYLHLMHGYKHVDGDGPLKKAHIPRNRVMSFDYIKNCFTCMTKGGDGLEELWHPYMDEITKHTIEAAQHSDKVVLSHATYPQLHREFVVEKLVEAGAKRENITVLQLMIDPDVKFKGLYYRTKEMMENGGMTMGDFMRTNGWEGEGDITCSEYIELSKKSPQETAANNAFDDIPSGYGKIVDVTGRDMTHLDGIDEALGLTGKRNDITLTFEEIRDKVKPFDQKRNEDMAATGAQEVAMKIFKEATGGGVVDENEGDDDVVAIATTDTEEQNKIAKRRSSLISVEYLERELRRSSLKSSNEKKIMKARRSSLIKTGKN